MAERKQVDWESVERDYSAGLLSLREIAAKYNTTHTTIKTKADKENWSRNLGAKIAAAADKKLSKLQLSTELSKKNSITEKEIIDSSSQVIVSIKLSHRKQIKKLNGLIESQMDEIEELNKNKSAENLLMRVDVTKKLMDTLKTSIDKEREAYGITNLEQTQKPVENMTNDELERKIAELVNRSF